MQSVLIIGAGLSGLAAAQTLANAGQHVIILEARERMGGRVYTVSDPHLQVPLELGAEFLHGKPKELWDVVNKENLVVGSIEGDNWCFENNTLQKCNDFWARWERVAEELKNYEIPSDRSFIEFINTIAADRETKRAALEFVQGFNAARATNISVQYLASAQETADRISGDKQFRVLAGLDSIVRSLAQFDASDVELHFHTPVHELEWRRGYVRAAGYEADCAIVTVPLGVLQRGRLRFIPSLEGKASAARAMVMGKVVKVILSFHTAFWEDRGVTNLSFLHARGQSFPTWWTTRPIQAPILVGWAGGPAAEKLASMGDSFILAAAIHSLANVLKTDAHSVERRIHSYLISDWQQDPYSLGAYSYIPVGAINAPSALAAPVDGTLFFAGEATDSEGRAGTMHGAIASGYRAADELLSLRYRQAA